MRIKVKSRIYPSEDPEKVRESVNNLFPDLDLELEEDRLLGVSEDLGVLEVFRNKLGLQTIRGAARNRFREGKREDSITFLLNKQAAKVGKVSFSDFEVALGSIEVTIGTRDSDELIDYLAPSD